MKTLTLFQAYQNCQGEMSWCENQRSMYVKTLTLFQAYQNCQGEMSWCENQRSMYWDNILVSNDFYARRYQRFCRLLTKLSQAIIARLSINQELNHE